MQFGALPIALRSALRRPVVGVCFGMQLLALLYGGKLSEPLCWVSCSTKGT